MVQEVEDQILIKQKIIEDQVNTIDRQKTELEKKSFELQKAKEDSKKDLSDMKQLQEDAFNKKLAEMKKAHEEVLKKQLAEMKKTQEEVKAKADEYKRKTEELEKAKTPTRNANVEVGEKEAVNKDIAVSFFEILLLRDVLKFIVEILLPRGFLYQAISLSFAEIYLLHWGFSYKINNYSKDNYIYWYT